MTERIGSFFFKARSFTPVPFLLVILAFARPSWMTVISGVFFMLIGEAIRIWGVGYAGFITRTRNVGADVLVTGGPFSIIRNPLYAGNFLISLGACVAMDALIPWTLIFFLLLYSLQYHFIVALEEATLEKKFGEVYLRYKECVPRFFPGFRKYNEPSTVGFNASVAFANERKTFLSIFIITSISVLFTIFGNPFLSWIRS